MIEEKIEKKFFAGDVQSVLPANKGKAHTKFDEKFLNVVEQAEFEITFAGRDIHREEVKNIWVLERLMSQV